MEASGPHRLVSFTELCVIYGISRLTGYQWLARANASAGFLAGVVAAAPMRVPRRRLTWA